VTIYNNVGKTLYYWNETDLPLKPTIQMNKPARPQKLTFSRRSRQNGALTWLQFYCKTTNFLREGDKIIIEMPYPVFIKETTKCFGMSSNVKNTLPCKVSRNMRRVEVTLLIPDGVSTFSNVGNKRGRGLQYKEMGRHRLLRQIGKTVYGKVGEGKGFQ
jgi:hypothetical protein